MGICSSSHHPFATTFFSPRKTTLLLRVFIDLVYLIALYVMDCWDLNQEVVLLCIIDLPSATRIDNRKTIISLGSSFLICSLQQFNHFLLIVSSLSCCLEFVNHSNSFSIISWLSNRNPPPPSLLPTPLILILF